MPCRRSFVGDGSSGGGGDSSGSGGSGGDGCKLRCLAVGSTLYRTVPLRLCWLARSANRAVAVATIPLRKRRPIENIDVLSSARRNYCTITLYSTVHMLIEYPVTVQYSTHPFHTKLPHRSVGPRPPPAAPFHHICPNTCTGTPYIVYPHPKSGS